MLISAQDTRNLNIIEENAHCIQYAITDAAFIIAKKIAHHMQETVPVIDTLSDQMKQKKKQYLMSLSDYIEGG